MSAIENCRTAALGGHVEACEDCGHWCIAYNSCRNRHCPKCQGAAARNWLAEREADLLPVGYFHVVFTLPTEIADIAGQNKASVYDLLFRAASETMMTIAADPKHLGARIGITAVLHTWGSAMTHHPHIHMIVPGGGISLDGRRWISSRPAFLLPVRVLGMLFRRLFLTGLIALHEAGRLAFFGTRAGLADRRAFLRHLAAVRKKRFVVYAVLRPRGRTNCGDKGCAAESAPTQKVQDASISDRRHRLYRFLSRSGTHQRGPSRGRAQPFGGRRGGAYPCRGGGLPRRRERPGPPAHSRTDGRRRHPRGPSTTTSPT
jgi:hypothetical protein